jgi:hypothetical protein
LSVSSWTWDQVAPPWSAVSSNTVTPGLGGFRPQGRWLYHQHPSTKRAPDFSARSVLQRPARRSHGGAHPACSDLLAGEGRTTPRSPDKALLFQPRSTRWTGRRRRPLERGLVEPQSPIHVVSDRPERQGTGRRLHERDRQAVDPTARLCACHLRGRHGRAQAEWERGRQGGDPRRHQGHGPGAWARSTDGTPRCRMSPTPLVGGQWGKAPRSHDLVSATGPSGVRRVQDRPIGG